MFAAELAERMQGFDDARALRPAAAGAGRERQYAHSPIFQRFDAKLNPFLWLIARRIGKINNIRLLDIFDHNVWSEAVLRQPGTAILQIRPDLFVLLAVASIIFQQAREILSTCSILPGSWKQSVKEDFDHPAQCRIVA